MTRTDPKPSTPSAPTAPSPAAIWLARVKATVAGLDEIHSLPPVPVDMPADEALPIILEALATLGSRPIPPTGGLLSLSFDQRSVEYIQAKIDTIASNLSYRLPRYLAGLAEAAERAIKAGARSDRLLVCPADFGNLQKVSRKRHDGNYITLVCGDIFTLREDHHIRRTVTDDDVLFDLEARGELSARQSTQRWLVLGEVADFTQPPAAWYSLSEALKISRSERATELGRIRNDLEEAARRQRLEEEQRKADLPRRVAELEAELARLQAQATQTAPAT
jgi:hypothetical protein